MSSYAKIENGIVTQIIVATAEYIATLSGQWVETDYTSDDPKERAGIGYYYDSIRSAFIPPVPGSGYVYNESTGVWEEDTTLSQRLDDIEAALLDLAGA